MKDGLILYGGTFDQDTSTKDEVWKFSLTSSGGDWSKIGSMGSKRRGHVVLSLNEIEGIQCSRNEKNEKSIN